MSHETGPEPPIPLMNLAYAVRMIVGTMVAGAGAGAGVGVGVGVVAGAGAHFSAGFFAEREAARCG
ncbi:hypothetical protein [Streptomyces decoyicus]|uniref:hypothetical protein n=1 Tax=Streptomyces decoyicus TaxID=249567 RepID=UPI0036642C78